MLKLLRRLAKSRGRYHALGALLFIALLLLAVVTPLTAEAGFLIALCILGFLFFVALLREAIADLDGPLLQPRIRQIGPSHGIGGPTTVIEGASMRFMEAHEPLRDGAVLSLGQSVEISIGTGLRIGARDGNSCARSVIVMCDGPARIHGPACYERIAYEPNGWAADFVEFYDRVTSLRLFSLCLFWACLVGMPLGYLYQTGVPGWLESVLYILKVSLVAPLMIALVWAMAGGLFRSWLVRYRLASSATELRICGPARALDARPDHSRP